MPVVEIQMSADELTSRTTEMRAWLAWHRAPGKEIVYSKASSRAVVRVNLATDADAETFAKRFGGRVIEQ